MRAITVILLEGTNDIGSEGATSAAIIAGDQQIIDQAHHRSREEAPFSTAVQNYVVALRESRSGGI